MVNDDTPLNALDLTLALQTLIAQMVTAVESIETPAVSAGSAAYGASNRGNGILLATVTDGTAQLQQSCFAETLSLLCTSDASTGATNFNEPFQVRTPQSIDPLDWRWQVAGSGYGSGVSTNISSVNPQADNSQGNLLANSDFESFTVNVPTNWTITTGAAGWTSWPGAGPTLTTARTAWNSRSSPARRSRPSARPSEPPPARARRKPCCRTRPTALSFGPSPRPA